MTESIPEISLTDAKERLDAGDTTFVDIRDPDSYESAHIPGAIHLGNDTIQDFIAKHDRAKPVIVYCYHGNSSRGATSFLMEQGFNAVHSMSGGFEGWRGTYPS